MSASGLVMVHHPTVVQKNDGPSMMQRNKVKSLSASFRNEHVIYNRLQIPTSKKTGADYFCRSHASQFAASGVMQRGKHYARDPVTGTWFKEIPERRADLHHSRSDLCYRYTESKLDKGDTAKTFTIWAAPCAGGFWKEPVPKPDKPTGFGFTDGPVQRHIPMDPKDMPDALSPLSRTASAPNYLPMTMSRKALAASQRSSLGQTGSAMASTVGSP